MSLVYRFESETKPITPLRLKVEINTREHFFVLGPRRIRFTVDNPWHSGDADVLTYEPEELLGTKLRALYQGDFLAVERHEIEIPCRSMADAGRSPSRGNGRSGCPRHPT